MSGAGYREWLFKMENVSGKKMEWRWGRMFGRLEELGVGNTWENVREKGKNLKKRICRLNN